MCKAKRYWINNLCFSVRYDNFDNCSALLGYSNVLVSKMFRRCYLLGSNHISKANWVKKLFCNVTVIIHR